MSKQRRLILRFIDGWVHAKGYPPTTREIAIGLGYASVSTVHDHLAILREQGAVDWQDGMARTLTITKIGKHAIRTAIVTATDQEES